MSNKKFIKKILVKVVCFIVFSVIIFSILSMISPILNNHLALEQMKNDDVSFMIWESWNLIKKYTTTIYIFIALVFSGKIVVDIYNFIKSKEKKVK